MRETDETVSPDETHAVSRRLWLVRHGLTAWNVERRFCGQSDVPLAREGRLQARWLARRLQAVQICALYTSDLWRTRETAEIIARTRAQQLQIKALAGWREIDFGAWDGLTYAEIARAFPEQTGFFSDPERYTPPDGESLAQLEHRVVAVLARVMRECATTRGDIVIVSHGGPLRVLLSSVLGMPLARQWQLALDPGSLSALDLLPLRDPLAPQGTLALLNLQRSSLRRTFPHATKGVDL